MSGGSGGGSHQPGYPPNQPSGGDGLSGTIGSLLGGVLGGGGGGHQQPPGYQPSGGYGGYQSSGGYPSGGYGGQSSGSDFLSGIGSAIGSSLFSSALDGLNKHGKDVSKNNCDLATRNCKEIRYLLKRYASNNILLISCMFLFT